MKNGGRDWSYAAINEEMPGATESAEGEEGFFPTAFRGSMALSTLISYF